MAFYFIKLYDDILDDHKLGHLPDHLWRRAIELFLLANRERNKGTSDEGFLPPVDEMAWTLRCTPEQIEQDLQELHDLTNSEGRPIVKKVDGLWFVTRFADRQEPIDPAERQRRKRERDRKESHSSNASVTDSHAPVTSRDTDIDIELDSELELELDPDIAADAAPPQQPPPEKPKASKATTHTAGQRGFLEKHGAKRFKNRTQAEAVLTLEQLHGTTKLLEGATWTAKTGMTLGKAVLALETALPKWGEPKSRGSPGDLPEAKSAAVIRAWAEEQGV